MLRDEANAEADDDQRAAAAAGGSFNAGPNGESFSVRASLPCSVFTGVTAEADALLPATLSHNQARR